MTSGFFGLFVKTRKSFKKTGYLMEIFICKFLLIFSMLVFVQVFVVSLPCMYLFLFLGMSKVETPPLTPVRSKEVWLLPFFLDGFRSSLRMYQQKGDSAKGGNNSGKV